MIEIKRTFCIVLSVFIFSLSLPISAAASSSALPDYYSALPEPQDTDSIKYFVMEYNLGTKPGAFLYRVECQMGIKDVLISVSDNYNPMISIIVENPLFKPYITEYVLTNGLRLGTSVVIENRLGDSNIYQYEFPDLNVQTYDVRINPLACRIATNFSLPGITLSWSDNTDPQVYIKWLTEIEDHLDDIETYSKNIDADLQAINDELTLFYDVFKTYSDYVTEYIWFINDTVESIDDRLRLFSYTNHEDLVRIEGVLSDIYDLLNEEASTIAAPEQDSQINDYVDAESALNQDYSSDLENQFEAAGGIFDNNGAFSFLATTFDNMLLADSNINSLIIFALAIGLCVLVLGRKINA